MNSLKKSYCRIYQTGLKALLPYLPYRDPVELNNYEEIADVLKSDGDKKPLIITDENILKNNLTKKLERALDENKLDYVIFKDVKANPTIENVEEAVYLYKQNNCDSLIAIGGGSVMDCAKAVGARIVRPRKNVKQLHGLLKVFKKLPTLIAIPTTVGTGSETTLASVITDQRTHHKFAINDFVLIPRYMILDKDLVKDLPPFITATTALDALTHAVEVYIGRSTTPETRKEARLAIKLILQNIEKAVFDPDDILAKEKLLRASNIAGKAFTRSYVGYIHAIAHSLGGEYDLPHGLANAVIMPTVLEAYGDSIYDQLYELAVITGLAPIEASRELASDIFIEKLRELNKKFDLPSYFDEIKVEDIPKLAKYADKEANPLYPVPKLMDRKELEDLYYKIKNPRIY